MSDYRSWCNFCGTQLGFGGPSECSCSGAKDERKKYEEQCRQDQEQYHQRLKNAKQYLLNLGLELNIKDFFDPKKGIVHNPSEEEYKKHFLNNDNINVVSYITMANFIAKFI